MNAIAEASNRHIDDHVDEEVAACLNLETPRSFFLFAGAGSGKTRSLVTAMRHLSKAYGELLRLRGQRVAVITYTNAARDEITERIEFNSLFHVATIHSFAWSLIKGFNSDIRIFLKTSLARDIDDLEALEAKGRKGTKASIERMAQIDSKGLRLAQLDQIKSFIYSPNGDNRERNSLSHSEVIEITADFLVGRPLMQRLLVQQYPVILIDEGQDTNKGLVDAFFAVQTQHRERVSVGLIGDTMQRIYNDGKEDVERALPADWEKPAKKLNFRSPKRIVRLINRIRAEVDDHQQEPISTAPEGMLRLFLAPQSIDERESVEKAVRARMAQITEDAEWNDLSKCKILTLEHHMAATRMGFAGIFEPLAAVSEFRTGLLDGSLPATRFFAKDVLSLVEAEQRGDKFAAANAIRDASPLFSPDAVKKQKDAKAHLASVRAAVKSLMGLWVAGEPKCIDVLANVAASGLFYIPDSLRPILRLRQAPFYDAQDYEREPNEADQLSDRAKALEAFLEAPFSEVPPYARYVAGLAEFDTHQGVKGREFDRVMAIMDDSESRGFMFKYEKLFGAEGLSDTDRRNVKDGKETSLDRTRRLLYVTASRARQSLALLLYSANSQAVRDTVLRNGWFRDEEVILL
jgi:DNA helicase-2/ATP-dependent DNA helicase PcrA